MHYILCAIILPWSFLAVCTAKTISGFSVLEICILRAILNQFQAFTVIFRHFEGTLSIRRAALILHLVAVVAQMSSIHNDRLLYIHLNLFNDLKTRARELIWNDMTKSTWILRISVGSADFAIKRPEKMTHFVTNHFKHQIYYFIHLKIKIWMNVWRGTSHRINCTF